MRAQILGSEVVHVDRDEISSAREDHIGQHLTVRRSLNDRDRTMVAALRSRGAIPAHLAVEFAQPDQEPMLWLPDAVAGAVGMHHRGRDPEPYERLRHTITEHTIRLG